MNLLEVGKFLGEQGVECLAGLNETRFAPEFAEHGIRVIQSFVWPTRRHGETDWTEQPVGAFSDVLGNLGFADSDTLTAAIGHYEAIFALFAPDIVLAENAFGAVASARGRLPCIAFGTAACLPPHRGDGFAPRLDGPQTPSWPLETLRAGMNRALERCNRPPLAAVNALLGDIEVMPYGPLALDIYGPERTAPLLPPNLPGLPRPVPIGNGEAIFAYLHAQTQRFPSVLEGLVALPGVLNRPGLIHMPGMTAETRAGLVQGGWRVAPGAVPLPEILANARCVVHHGGTQLTTACLAAAIPQVLLPKELDNEIAAHLIATRGLGLGRYLAKSDGRWLVEAVRRAAGDEALRRRGREAAPGFHPWVASDPAEIVAARALALMADHRATSP